MGVSPRRIMTNVPPMPALKLGNPIQIFIQLKINDFSHRPFSLCLDRFHIHLRCAVSVAISCGENNPVFAGEILILKLLDVGYLTPYLALYFGCGSSLRRAVTKSAIPRPSDPAPAIPGNELVTCCSFGTACAEFTSFLGPAAYRTN